MNNEEKILSILGTMQADISGLKQDVSGLKGDVADLKAGQANLSQRMASAENAILKTNITIENEIIPAIRLLAEGHAEMAEHMEQLVHRDEFNELRDDVKMLLNIVQGHGEEIRHLKLVEKNQSAKSE